MTDLRSIRATLDYLRVVLMTIGTLVGVVVLFLAPLYGNVYDDSAARMPAATRLLVEHHLALGLLVVTATIVAVRVLGAALRPTDVGRSSTLFNAAASLGVARIERFVLASVGAIIGSLLFVLYLPVL